METRKFTQAVTELERGTFFKNSGTKFWTTALKFSWYLNYENKTGRITVPENFKTDFGSVPFFLWWVFNPTHFIAYVLHDYLYFTKGKFVNEHGITIKLTRKEVDQIMHDALIVENCNGISAKFQYYGVRIGGWLHWHFL